MATIPTDNLFALADMLGMELEQLKTKVVGTAKVRVPISKGTNLVSKLKVVADYHNDKASVSMLAVHMREDLYFVLTVFGDDLLRVRNLYALDEEKMPVSMENIFKHLRTPDKIVARFTEGIVGAWYYNDKDKGWHVNSVGGQD